jgi:hypothetical protein
MSLLATKQMEELRIGLGPEGLDRYAMRDPERVTLPPRCGKPRIEN